MTYTDIKRQLQSNTVPKFLIFTGDEREVQLAYIRKIAENKKQILKRIDGVGEAFKSQGLSLFSESFCYVCSDDAEFQKAESVWEKVEDNLGSNTLIYQATKIDKRSKFYGFFKDLITEFDYMTDQVLTKHIKEQSELSTKACEHLINICEHDYSRILTELNKMDNYIKATNGKSWDLGFEQLVQDGTIHQPPNDAIFDWANAMLNGKPRLAFKLYEECVEIGEPSLRLLLVLYQSVKRLLQVQSCEASNIAENTGLSQWEINIVKDYIGIYRNIELVNALRNIRALEVGIKTGQVQEELTVPYAMINLLRA